jgi:hypothetical protein
MDWAPVVVQWLHVLLGIFWFGSVLALDFLVLPAISRLPAEGQRAMGDAYGRVASRIIPPVGLLVIALGILRGTVFGTIRDLDTLVGSAYGVTWLVALVAAIATFLWGGLVLGPAAERFQAIPAEDAVGADGTASPVFTAAVARIKLLAMLELVGFLVIFSCMILMRFGL